MDLKNQTQKREIKFRAWDKTYNRMNYKVQIGNTDYADENYTCNSIWVDYGVTKTVGWMNADDRCIDIMQYTGLKDEKGKEIYEGDILSWRGNDNKDNKKLSKVIFKNGSFEVIGITWMASWYLGEYNESYEVIGNIFENPELLER